ncbi:hypothetical protein KBD59_01095 [Candidatus Gracilibacteria bacterium]|nr:hypothetical protein [Candidatus Gracilibacteria bacterium]
MNTTQTAKSTLIGLATIALVLNGYVSAAQEKTTHQVVYNNAATTTSTTSVVGTEKTNARSSSSTPAEDKEENYSNLLASLPVRLKPGTDHRPDSKPTEEASRRCRAVVYETLAQLPANHRNQLKELTLFYTNDGRRGLGGNGSIVLRCLNVTRGELASVLTHEMGHIVDSSTLVGFNNDIDTGFYDFSKLVTVDDPSLQFYKIAWDSSEKMKDPASELDFVSGYAMSDPFEDFAETYAFYRLHGHEFRTLIQSSEMLKQKYEFMKTNVFYGQEFELDQDSEMDIWSRHYDVTVMPFDVQRFLAL